MAVAGFQVEEIDLIERIAGFALALKNQGFAVRCEIAFATPLAFEGQPTDFGEEGMFGIVGGRTSRSVAQGTRGNGEDDDSSDGASSHDELSLSEQFGRSEGQVKCRKF